MQPGNIGLAFLAGTVRNDGLALEMNLVGQPAGLRAGVTEELLEHEDDVRERVDRIVPHQDDPRNVGASVLRAEQLLDGVGDRDLLDVG